MAEYNHSQASASSSWVISHNLNASVIATDVFIDTGSPVSLTKVLPLSVTHTNDNTLTITFSVSQTGKARVVSK